MLARMTEQNGTVTRERLSLIDASVAFAMDSSGDKMPIITATSLKLVCGNETVTYHGSSRKISEFRRRIHLH